MSDSLQPHGLWPTRLLLCPWGFSREEYWSGMPCPPPGDLPNPGTEPRSPSFQADSLPAEPQGKPKNTGVGSLSFLQWIFSTQESNWGLLHCRQILYQLIYQGMSVQFSLFAQSCPAVCYPMDSSSPGLPVYCQLPEFTQTHVHWISDVIEPPHPLLSPSPPALYLSQHQGFSNESVLRIRWPKYWSFSFSISASSDYSGMISFRIDWLDLLAVQGALKSLLQHHSSKVSILWHSALFMVQLSHPYMITGKTIALTTWTFVSKVMTLLFNMLSGFVITFFPGSKHLLISWLQSLSTVILEPKNIKPVSASTFSPSINIWHELMGLDAMISGFLMLNFKPAFHSPLSPSRKGSLGPVLVSANFFLHFSNTRDAKITSLF